mmetsp:Transcript_11013/g.23346  ORF Transcript_11013/g.23346 Transcript_11013/m.23346 type:complete len:303 (-) Transcript_11013:130-1038(-)
MFPTLVVDELTANHRGGCGVRRPRHRIGMGLRLGHRRGAGGPVGIESFNDGVVVGAQPFEKTYGTQPTSVRLARRGRGQAVRYRDGWRHADCLLPTLGSAQVHCAVRSEIGVLLTFVKVADQREGAVEGVAETSEHCHGEGPTSGWQPHHHGFIGHLPRLLSRETDSSQGLEDDGVPCENVGDEVDEVEVALSLEQLVEHGKREGVARVRGEGRLESNGGDGETRGDDDGGDVDRVDGTGRCSSSVALVGGSESGLRLQLECALFLANKALGREIGTVPDLHQAPDVRPNNETYDLLCGRGL